MNPFEQGSQGGKPDRTAPVLTMPPPNRKRGRWTVWRSRLFLFEYAFVCLVIGILLIVAPWTPLWADNSLLLGYPQVQQALMNDFVRGLISGIGLVDIWLAISEVIAYRD